MSNVAPASFESVTYIAEILKHMIIIRIVDLRIKTWYYIHRSFQTTIRKYWLTESYYVVPKLLYTSWMDEKLIVVHKVSEQLLVLTGKLFWDGQLPIRNIIFSRLGLETRWPGCLLERTQIGIHRSELLGPRFKIFKKIISPCFCSKLFGSKVVITINNSWS